MYSGVCKNDLLKSKKKKKCESKNSGEKDTMGGCTAFAPVLGNFTKVSEASEARPVSHVY